MKLDNTLVREIKTKLYCNGDREAKFAALKKVRAACADLSTINVCDTFDDCMRKHGRAVVAVCVAATLEIRKERLDWWQWEWAHEVLKLVSFFTPSNLESAHIKDGLHPTRICEYAGSLIKFTTSK